MIKTFKNIILFNKRFEFYLELKDIRDNIYTNNKHISSKQIFDLARKSYFLFGEDISKLVKNFNKDYDENPTINDVGEFDKHFDKYLKL